MLSSRRVFLLTPPSTQVRASSVYGAIYGIETFSQLIEAGGLINASGVTVSDSPSFEHRWVVTGMNVIFDYISVTSRRVSVRGLVFGWLTPLFERRWVGTDKTVGDFIRFYTGSLFECTDPHLF